MVTEVYKKDSITEISMVTVQWISYNNTEFIIVKIQDNFESPMISNLEPICITPATPLS